MSGLPWRRVAPIAAAAASLVLVVILLPSLPTTNPNVASAGIPGSTGATPGGPNFGPSANPSGGATPGVAPGSQGVIPGSGSAAGSRAGYTGGGATTPAGTYSVGGTAYSNGGATYQGVTGNSITTAFHWASLANECPGDQNLLPFLGALDVKPDPVKSLNVLVPWFNAHAAQLFPSAAAQLGSHGFYGREIKPVYEDSDGGPFCPDVNRSVAQKIATQDKAFAAIGGCISCVSQGESQVMQPILASYHVLDIEATQNRASWYQPLQPYAWSVLAGGDTIVKHLVGLICNLYVGKNSSNTGDATTSNRPRVYSIVNLDDNELNAIGDDLINKIRSCGATIAQGAAAHEEYAKDASTAAQQAVNVEAQQRSAGVTTIVCLCDAIAALVGTNENHQTNWHPEYLASDIGFLDAPQSVNTYPADVWQNAVVTAESNEYDHATAHWCDIPAGRVWCASQGNAQPPIDFELWFDTLVEYAAQIIVAGPTLTPQNVQQNLFSYCGPSYCPGNEFARPNDFKTAFGPNWPDGPWSTVKDYELVKWDPNAVSPYLRDLKNSGPDAANPPKGSYEPFLQSLGWTRLRDWGIRS